MTRPTDAEVQELVARLRVTTPEPGEMGSHRLRRYAIQRYEAANMIEALQADLAWLDRELREHGYPEQGPMRSRCRAAAAQPPKGPRT